MTFSVAENLKQIVEAALLAAGRPLSIDALQALFGEIEAPDRGALRSVLESLRDDYQGRGIEVVEVSSGWRIQVGQGCSPWVSRLWEERPPRYSRALLETLALIAYRQPITRGEIEDIRGVSVSTNIIKTLLEREWVRVVGQRDVPGKPSLYGTTREFLDYFGLKSLDELPTLAELRDLDEINRELDLVDPAAAGAAEADVEAGAEATVNSEAEAEAEAEAEIRAEAETETEDTAEAEAETEAAAEAEAEAEVAAAAETDAEAAADAAAGETASKAVDRHEA